MGEPLRRPHRRLLVLRHGLTAHNALGIWQGHLDVPLNADGIAQAQATAPVLAAYAPGRIVSSDLARARATAEIVGETLALEVADDSRLREIHCGAWQGLSRAEVDVRFAAEQAALADGHDIPRGGHGERVADVVARARPAVEDALADRPAGQTVLVVTHGVTARGLVGDLLGLDPATAWRALGTLDNCAWACLEEGARGWRLQAWNVTADPVVETAARPA